MENFSIDFHRDPDYFDFFGLGIFNNTSIFIFLLCCFVFCGMSLCLLCCKMLFLCRRKIHSMRIEVVPEYSSQVDIFDSDEDFCSICLDTYKPKDKIKTLPCKHRYHRKCINQWLINPSNTCPQCRACVK